MDKEKPVVRMISSESESAASQERPRERERHRERVVIREGVCISNLLFTPALLLAGSQKKTSPHYYFICTGTHGSIVCVVVVYSAGLQMCHCSNRVCIETVFKKCSETFSTINMSTSIS